MENETDVVIVTNVYGDVCIRKARRKRQKMLVQELLYDYANNTTLHGLPYMARQGVTLIEKIFWLLTFLVSTAICLYLISEVWFKWQHSPVIVTVSEQLMPVGMVPFPSVTICPQSKIKLPLYNYSYAKSKIRRLMAFMKINKSLLLNQKQTEEMARFADVSLICGTYNADMYDFTAAYPNKHSDASVVKHISEVSPNITDVFFWCKIRGETTECDKIFNSVITKEGICFNMNSISADEIFRTQNLHTDFQYLTANKSTKGWSMAYGYSAHDDVYPVPGAENSAFPDVEIVLKHKLSDVDQLCNVISTGFKVYVQHPADLPQSSLYYYAVLHGQISSMALSFSALNSSEKLKKYDSKVRQCYFEKDKQLKYFQIYTASNCRMECFSNVTYETCGCVEFYMPHENSTEICTILNADCLKKAREKLREEESGSSPKCNCLPPCNSVDYGAEILKTDYRLKTLFKVTSDINRKEYNSTGYRFSSLEMYFKSPRFISMRRSELFGVVDFFSNIGGLMSLFLGFSFLSLVEIIYFLTLRLCCTLKKDLEEEKAQHSFQKEIHIEKY